MSMLASPRRIGSAYFVHCGRYGDVQRFARQQGVSRQWVYREAQQVTAVLEGRQTQQEVERLRCENQRLQTEVAELRQRLTRAVELDDAKQEEFAGAGQACGVTLGNCRTLLKVLIPGRVLSVASLGRRTHAAGVKAGPLLQVFDAVSRPLVRDAAADEIYVNDPVLMVVEQASLCWVTGQRSASVSGPAWAHEYAQLPNLEQLARDGGPALANGVILENEQRQQRQQRGESDQGPIVAQGDHFHALWHGGVGLRKAEARTRQAWAKAESAEQAWRDCVRQGQPQTGPATRVYHAWQAVEQAMDEWQRIARLWQQTKDALPLITPAGALNTRAQAEAVLAQTLPQLPQRDFAKTKRRLQRPEMLNHLDGVQARLAQLPFAEEVRHAAVQQEALRRRPELLKGDGPQAAARRGVLVLCAVVLGRAEQGQQAVAAVREIFRRAYRASSLVECINSVLRMQQAQHRKLTQGLLDLKRLYWNCHTFRTGHRRGTTPYQRLGVPWPEGLRWWDVLKLTPEQLREKLSTAKNAA
jgi:hypothetical protein